MYNIICCDMCNYADEKRILPVLIIRNVLKYIFLLNL